MKQLVIASLCVVTLACANGSGAPGEQGPKGDKGDPGATGPAGEPVRVNVLPMGNTDCSNGGVELVASDGRRVVCNGRNGSTPDASVGPPGRDGMNGMNGTNGMDGMPGMNGTNGTNGLNGLDGISVTVATEPAGTPCAAGGLVVTGIGDIGLGDAGLVTRYVCNGTSQAGSVLLPDGGLVVGGVPFVGADAGLQVSSLLTWSNPQLSTPSVRIVDGAGGVRGFVGAHSNAPGTNLTVRAGEDTTEARGGNLDLRAGNAFLSSSVFCNAGSCNGTPSSTCPGPENNSVRIFAGDNGINAFWTCSDLRNGDIEFYAGNGQPERMRIQGNTGNVGIGTATPSQRLQVNGNILASGTITPSDARLKENIVAIERARELVRTLHGVHYTWKKDAQSKFGTSDTSDVGLLAQDVQKVLPEAVVTLPDGTLTVNYDKVVPLLVEALKAQDEKLRQLEQTDARLKAMERRLELLERH